MKDDDLPEDVRIARKCTEDAIVQLNEEICRAQPRPDTVTYWSVRANAFSNREVSASGLAASERVSERVTALIVSGETTGGKLATWTKGLAIATFILAGATIALVVVEALKH